MKYGFIGLGLIGGSIAKAIHEKIEHAEIIAYDINREATQQALAEGVITQVAAEIGFEFRECDYIFLCAPVQKNDENLLKIRSFLKPGAIVTDVGSVKTPIHEVIREAGLEGQFIGGHPMAGSERIGYAASKATILQNAYYILTATPKTPHRAVDAFRDLVSALGALPIDMTYEQHDYIVAGVSHLPHVIAASLVNLVKDSDSADGLMKMVAAGGFKDITRIASSSPVMWQQICLSNGENILKLLDAYIGSLQGIRGEIADKQSEDLYRLFDSARTYRDSFVGTSAGPIKVSYALTIDIADEPGALAAIATILALNGISIKNIGILHNRGYLGGDLRVEFYDEDGLNKAREVLNAKAYTTHG